MTDYTPCPSCGGEGWIDGLVVGDAVRMERCGRCRGTGDVARPDEWERAAVLR